MITIQNNKRQRRILIFDSAFNLEESNDFLREMFDAVFILTPSADEVKSILHTINPVTSNKCCYKPFLVSRSLKGQLDEYDKLIDDYTYDIDDDETLDIVDEIINHIGRIGLQPDDNQSVSGNLFFIRLYRYLISRHIYNLTPELNGMSSMGYTIPIFELFFQQEAYSLNEYIMFNQSLLEKGYIRTVSFINKIYLCPRCLHSHLLYIENCPHCHRSSIKSEEVIHHFRCANISPEHTYNFGGQLRCPKCHQMLRHIGVDYDRPSVVYTCANCENTFLQPHMAAICTSCDNHAGVSELTPHDITAFGITEEGCRAIVSPNIGFTIYTDFYDNYMDFERFVGKLRLLSELKMNGTEGEDANVEIIKIWILNGKEETCLLESDFIALFCKCFPTYRVSSANNMVYIKSTLYDGELGNTEFIAKLNALLYKAALSIGVDERICYVTSRLSGNMEKFTDSLNYISPFPDKTFVSRREERQEVSVETDKTETVEEETSSTISTEDAPLVKELRFKRGKVIVVSLLVLVALSILTMLYFTKKQTADADIVCPGMEMKTLTDTLLLPMTGNETVVKECKTEENKSGKPESDKIELMEPGVYYAVLSVFRSKEYALTQLSMEAARHPEYEYHVYRYGDRFVVSPFRSDDRTECQRFISLKEWNGDAWIAERKK